MKILEAIQTILAIVLMVCGIILFISETPITASLWEQIKLTGAGVLLIALSVGWLFLLGREEEKFETR